MIGDFDLMVRNSWARMFGELDALKQQSLANLVIQTQDRPNNLQLALTQTPPGHTLLGLYYQNRIILFQEPIRQAALNYNQSMDEIAEQVMRHEVWQHHFGTNHTVRPSAPRSLDEHYSRPARCCPGAEGWW